MTRDPQRLGDYLGHILMPLSGSKNTSWTWTK